VEGLSTRHKSPVITSESVRSRITEDIDSSTVSVYLRDTAQVKGRTQGLHLCSREQSSRKAKLIRVDEFAVMMISLSEHYVQQPPGPGSNNGMVAMGEK